MEETLQPRAKETRQRILEAALRVFAAKGYHEARMDDIVAAADASKGAIYFHFPSKERIFLALVDEFAELLESRLERALAEERSGVRRVEAALRVCMELFGRYRQLAKVVLVQAAGLGHVFEQKRLEVHERFIAIIKRELDRAVAEGDIPPIDTEVAALVWMGALNEVVIRWIYSGTPEPERSLPALRALLLRSIGVNVEAHDGS
ncbi:MAG: TetR/AcrR family transcriptional regulator [Thermoflexales bacterium]|nr:TetR/AcrR family transcriptional regulator [Thermoflexales bacterium]MCS7324640.1 TetR/AcrR family transcriptional regulator [Thermoflexales bacterium]MCX7939308.1 TetR/AcrR family transcriptional regulator [Thermoflexales bacterium]MDW8054393.1 TetR/AcrR family transcriptional regulator [Anaerolineae bacterium]MDW8292805.1 TetR/AcrR family transcriptional regulator [Anaerolineae bacterium]